MVFLRSLQSVKTIGKMKCGLVRFELKGNFHIPTTPGLHFFLRTYTVQCHYNAVNFRQYRHVIPQSSPVRVMYGVSVVSFKSDSCSAAVIAVLCVMS